MFESYTWLSPMKNNGPFHFDWEERKEKETCIFEKEKERKGKKREIRQCLKGGGHGMMVNIVGWTCLPLTLC